MTFNCVEGTAITKALHLGVGVTGITEKAAKGLGIPAKATTVQQGTREHYFPTPGSTNIKLIRSLEDGKLLGAQIAGPVLETKRIDVFATALHHGPTVEDVARLDLSYAPPFAPVRDPIVVAANVAAKD